MGAYARDDGTWSGDSDLLVGLEVLEILDMLEDVFILGIESSCDDTSAAVLKNGVLLSNVTAS